MTDNLPADTAAPDGSLSRLDLLEAFADGGEAFARAVASPEPPAVRRIAGNLDAATAPARAAAAAARAPMARTASLVAAMLDRAFAEPFREAERRAASRPKTPPRPHLFKKED